MTTTGPLIETAELSRIDVTPEEFERRLAAHGHDADEIHHLWDELAAGEADARSVTASQGRPRSACSASAR